MGDLNNLDIGWRSALLLALVSPILFAAAMLILRDVEQRASRYLAGLICLYALGLTPQIIGFAGAYQVWPGLTFAPFNNELWLGPLLLFHVHTLISEKPLGRMKWLLLPGAVQTLYYTGAFLLFEDYRAKWAFNDAFHEPYIVPGETLLTLAVSLTCFYVSWRLIKDYRTFLEQTQSAVDEFDPSWLSVFLQAIGVAFALWLGFEVVDTAMGGLSYDTQYPVHVLLAVIVNVFALQAISRLRHRYPKQGSLPVGASLCDEIEDQQWQKLVALLPVEMQAKQWYLQPRLSITDVARALGSNETYVSRALNQGMGISFNRFVNQARVEYAQQLLRAQPDAALLNIAFEAGFNSKASFNRLFKEISSVTPSQYRDAHTLQSA